MDEWPTFDAVWRRTAEEHSARPFLVFEGPDAEVSAWSYGEFDDVVTGAAARFVELGVGRGDAVHLALTNSPAFVAAWLAAVRLGAWIVPSDPQATAPELTEHLGRTTPKLGICATARAATYREAAASGLPRWLEVDEWAAGHAGSLAWVGDPRRSTTVDPPAPTDRAAVMFTSGTTGRPKGVEVTQANYAFAGAVMAAASDVGPDDRQLVVLPLFHANAQYYSFAAAIAVGASIALMHTFSASRFLLQAATHSATCASLFAGPMRMILARGAPLGPGDPALHLRHCWFAQNLTADQYDTISAWFGCRPRQLYGMTETMPAVLTDEREAPCCDTMGYVTERCVVDVQDADGRSCAAGEEGEIVVGGTRGWSLFAGYLDDPATTAASFRDGWFVTGDRGTRDERDRHGFVGRRSDVLKVSGENVSVVEVETVLAEHPAVHDVAVVGRADAVRDEVPVAFVVVTGGGDWDEDRTALAAELREWCAARLAKAKRPRDITFVTELPRTSVGKIRKFELKEALS